MMRAPMWKARLLAVALAAPLALLVACGSPPDAATEEAASSPPVRASVVHAKRGEAPRFVELQGSVEAEQVATVSARVMATVTAVHVGAGDRVTPGQLLLTLDPQAAQGEVSRARGALAQAQAALTLAQRNHQRFVALAASDAASALELDLAVLELEQARGAVEQAQGGLAAASSMAGDSRVAAPFAGRVVQRLVEVGDLAAPGRPLLALESEGAVRLALAVPETVMARRPLEVGATLPVRIDARPDLGELLAVVVERSPGAHSMARSFQVKLLLPVADLSTGATGRAWIEVGHREVVSVPAAAVLRQGGLELVVLRTPEGRTTSRVVTVGAPLPAGEVEVLSGLDGGEPVLVGLAALPPAGTPVEEVR